MHVVDFEERIYRCFKEESKIYSNFWQRSLRFTISHKLRIKVLSEVIIFMFKFEVREFVAVI